MAKTAVSHLFESMSRYVNVDYSFISHSWFRDFLYEPHAATALSLLALVIYLNNRPATPISSLLAGLFLGTVAVTDIVVGMCSLTWFGTKSLWPFLRDSKAAVTFSFPPWRLWRSSLVGFALQVFPPGSGVLRPGLHPAIKYGPIYLLIDLGPLFLFGAAGLYLCLRRGLDTRFQSMTLLLALSLMLAFFVTVDIEPNHMIRKAIKVVELALVVFAAPACSRLLDLPARHWLRRRRCTGDSGRDRHPLHGRVSVHRSRGGTEAHDALPQPGKNGGAELDQDSHSQRRRRTALGRGSSRPGSLVLGLLDQRRV